jgi:hemoglobin
MAFWSMAQSTGMGKPLTLHERIGGSEVVDRMVGAFYQRILADPELLPLFEIASNAKLEQMQREFFAAAFNESIPAGGRPSQSVQFRSGIPSHYLPRFLDHFIATLKPHRLSDDDTRAIIARLHDYLNQVKDK